MLVVLGATLLIFANDVAVTVDEFLPRSGTGRGLGTNFPTFADVGPNITRRSAISLILVGASVMLTLAVLLVQDKFLVSTLNFDAENTDRSRHTVQWIIAAVSGGWYCWLSYPHNPFPTNSRIHWVDRLTWASDNFFYAASRLPHMAFYEAPYLWQGLNVALLVGLVAWISNLLKLSAPSSFLMCFTPAIASNVLLFMSTAEDVMLNLALFLLVIAAMLSRRPIFLGLALASAILGRPSSIVLIVAAISTELLPAFRLGALSVRERWDQIDKQFLARFTVVTTVAVGCCQLLFTLIGRRYMFVDGQVIAKRGLDLQEARDVDGFIISSWSGAYVFHLLWVMPLVLILGSFIATISTRTLDRARTSTVHFCGLSTLLILGVHEARPQMYYNVRYLTYVWPFLFVMSWIAYSSIGRKLSTHWKVGCLVALTAGVMVLPVNPLAQKRNVSQRLETELLHVRHAVDQLAADRDVEITFGSQSSRNLIAYVIRDNHSKISKVTRDEASLNALVITKRAEPLKNRVPSLSTESLLVYGPDR